VLVGSPAVIARRSGASPPPPPVAGPAVPPLSFPRVSSPQQAPETPRFEHSTPAPTSPLLLRSPSDSDPPDTVSALVSSSGGSAHHGARHTHTSAASDLSRASSGLHGSPHAHGTLEARLEATAASAERNASHMVNPIQGDSDMEDEHGVHRSETYSRHRNAHVL